MKYIHEGGMFWVQVDGEKDFIEKKVTLKMGLGV